MTFHMRAGVVRRRDRVAAFTETLPGISHHRGEELAGWAHGSYKLFRIVLLLVSTHRRFFTRAGIFTISLFSLLLLSFFFFLSFHLSYLYLHTPVRTPFEFSEDASVPRRCDVSCCLWDCFHCKMRKDMRR